ncbi:ComEC/Rec2 family competence protein [Streptomyces sp. ISL-86]|uniref:ComEC/Rec2 family competence protein n=1 Tax=Streptomyces sp. ISL-86 TaxID=2819187 RepID=UPI001BE781C2|nr:MBL fold metallo-hydrolase [Streptomyces sp. ISL-86]MBT2456850.1 MBL fold metallo-hydrolase [Streptomyces sp. ISL-86]
MLTFDFLNARYGDSFLVRWGASAKHVMLVDGGPSGVYEASLQSRLSQLPRNIRGIPQIDVVCLSHLDDDHAVGLLALLREMRRARQDGLPAPFAVTRLWFNSVEELVDRHSPGLSASVRPLLDRAARTDAAVGANYAKGWAIRDEAAALGLSGNHPFDGALAEGSERTLDGLRVTVVAPDTSALKELEQQWREAERKANPDVIAAAYKDDKVPNLSSIVLLLRHDGRTALLTGDARGDHILAGLRSGGLLTATAPLHLDLLKLPHHGSNRNVAPDFFDSLHSDHYVVSADGIKYHHPNEDTLQWLVESRSPDDEYVVHLTNHIPHAVDKLTKLRHGHRFKVDVRASTDPVLVIGVGDQP